MIFPGSSIRNPGFSEIITIYSQALTKLCVEAMTLQPDEHLPRLHVIECEGSWSLGVASYTNLWYEYQEGPHC